MKLEPGKIERRIINFFFEGLKRSLYDYASLRLGRESREADIFKDEIRRILKRIRQTCYEMVAEELAISKVLTGTDIVNIIKYVLPPDSENGVLWGKLRELIQFTFGGRSNEVSEFLFPRIKTYVISRLAQITDNYENEREGAIQHLRKVHED